MKGCSTFYMILAILVLILAGMSLLLLSGATALSLFLTAMLFFTISGFCDNITKIVEKQDEILRKLSEE